MLKFGMFQISSFIFIYFFMGWAGQVPSYLHVISPWINPKIFILNDELTDNVAFGD